MVNAIPSIPPLDAATLVNATEAAGPASPAGAGRADGAPALPHPPSELVNLFSSKLDAARLGSPTASHVHGPSAISEIVTHEDQAISRLSGEVDRFAGEAPQMSVQEVTAQSVRVQMEMAEMVGKLYVGEALAQGTKSSVQTLVKNQ